MSWRNEDVLAEFGRSTAVVDVATSYGVSKYAVEQVIRAELIRLKAELDSRNSEAAIVADEGARAFHTGGLDNRHA